MIVDASELTRGVLRVGDGRGFVVEHRNYLGHEERIVITAAHCLPVLPSCHPMRYLHECTYQQPAWSNRRRAFGLGDVPVR